MTDKKQDDYSPDAPPEEPSQGVKDKPREEPLHPGWLPLTKVPNFTDPVFEKINFLLSYEYSSNIYLLQNDYLTIVDPGNDYTAYIHLFEQGFNPADLKRIVLTHGHRDHCMGTFELLRYSAFKENPALEIFLHKDGPGEMKQMLGEMGCRYSEVQGGEILNLSGLEWEVIYTPGHSIDGITLYHAPSKTAITGDTVMPYAAPEVDKKTGGQLSHFLFAVRALLKKDIKHILPGHGVPVAGLGRTVIEQTYEGLMLQVLGVDPDSKVPWTSGAEALASQGLLEEAVFCWDKVLAADPENMRALQVKAMCLVDLGNGEEAIEVLDTILAREGQDAFALTVKGNALLGMAKYEESLEYFDRALKIAPQIQEAQVYKGMALYLLGRYDEAMDIDIFRQEFSSHLKTELEKLAQDKGAEITS
jgi:glyoxylase-like metal-dependent hydrolase (beta-lactamase superfamily II)